MPEALPDRAVDDEVDGGVYDEEEVVERYEHEEHRGQVVAPQSAAVVVVVFGLHVRPERLKWQNFVVLLPPGGLWYGLIHSVWFIRNTL